MAHDEACAPQVLEECGFAVDPARVLPVTAYHSAMGISGSRHSMFTADVDESMRTAPGGGLQCVPTLQSFIRS